MLVLILVVMIAVSFAQKQKPQSFKFDEFKKLQESDWKQRLDKFAEMQTGVSNSTLCIFVYARSGTERTSINKLKKEYQDYLRETKKIKRIFVESGGFRGSQVTELWICPENADFPEPTPEEKFKAEKIADFGVVNEPELKNYFQEFDNKLNDEPLATVCIVNYGNASEVSEREKLIRENIGRRFHHVRLTIVNGGENKELKTVLWLVPYGAEPPTP
jgi:hypothetical protein